MYKTKEELERTWPLGTVVAEEPIFQRFYCADEVMFKKIKEWFKDAEVEQTSPHHATVSRLSKKTIEGYLYNGETWYPMIRDAAGWSIYIPEVF